MEMWLARRGELLKGHIHQTLPCLQSQPGGTQATLTTSGCLGRAISVSHYNES